MIKSTVVELLNSDKIGTDVHVKGWVRTFRSNRFVALNDGSTINNIQCVVDFKNLNEALLKRITTGAAISINGELVESQGKGQKVEIKVTDLEILGDSNPEEYPIQPKRHSLEFLRENAHLRIRTNTFAAVMRVRSALSFAVHKYFIENGFYNFHAPIITGSDAEGAGEMFRVTTLPAIEPPFKEITKEETKLIAYSKFDDIALKYYNELINYIKESKTKNLEVVRRYVNELSGINELNFKEMILAKPDKLIKFVEFIDSDKSEKKKQIELFRSYNLLHNHFRESKFKTLSKKKLVEKIKSICKENGWKLDNIRGNNVYRNYNAKGYPVLSLSFYNLFSITNSNKVDYSQDFFGKETNLTVSGQLEAETYAMALGKVYTFGPTFRAENSNTTRHLSEFWMIEPEVAFNDLKDNMDLGEDFIKKVIKDILLKCKDDIEFLEQRLLQEEKSKPANQRSEMPLIEKLEFVSNNDFIRLSYTEAYEILRNCKPNKKKKFQFPINEWGVDLQSEHERYLVEKHFKCPVILFDYPANIKAFYMRENDVEINGKKTVAAMDILFPGIGEIVGGSQREERLDVLKQKMNLLSIDEIELKWYLDTRKFGTAVHSGFGLGFERLVQFVTGMGNIRDVIPFPRTPQNAEF